MRFRATLAVLLLAAWYGMLAAQVKITGPDKVPQYRLVRLTAVGAPDKSALIWDIDREESADVQESGSGILFVGPPGVYKVKLRVITFDGSKVTVDTARHTVTVEGPTPPPVPPDPEPGPGPGPDPKPPTSQKLHVTVIYDSTSADVKAAELLRSVTLRKVLDQAGHKLRLYDRSSQVLVDRKLKGRADAAGYPCIIIQSNDGKVWPDDKAQKLPATEADLLALVKKCGG